jgi:signal transduction histidine kinase
MSSHDKTAKMVFSKTANLIREAIEVEGCLFLDAATQAFGGMKSPSLEDPAPQDPNAARLSSGISSSDEDQAASSSNQPCQVLGFSNSEKSSIDGDNSSGSHGMVSEKLLAHMLRRYPKGKIFAFSSTGELQSSDSSEEDRDSLVCPQKTPVDTARRRKFNPRPQELEPLRQLFPGARSIAFVPVWNSKRNRWYAGGFVYTNAVARQFSVQDDLNYLRAFGTLAVNEVLRYDMVQDEKSKSDALSSLSHELRSPLHGIMLSIELLNDTVQTVLQGDITHTIETCGRTLLDTLDNLLDFSKINRFASSHKEHRRSQVFQKGASRTIGEGMMSLAANVRLDRLVEDVIESVFAGYNFQRLSVAQMSNRQEATHADVVSNRFLDGLRADEDLSYKTTLAGMMSHAHGDVWVFLNIDPESNWWFHAQPGAIRRIIMNLFGNALKFTTEGSIKVSLKQKPVDAAHRGRDRFVTISVSDTGSGIGQDFLQNDLFRPFLQEDPLRPGTGLGLSLVKKITSQLRGRINVESQVGVGTTVTVTLPLTKLSSASLSNLGLDHDQAFTQQVGKLQGLRVRLLSKLSTQDGAGGTTDEYASTESICRDWLRMEVVTASQVGILSADLVLLYEDELASLENHQVPSDTPCVVICRNTVTAYQHSRSSTLGKRLIEYVAQPYVH